MSLDRLPLTPRVLDLAGLSLVILLIGGTAYAIWPWRENEGLRAREQQTQATLSLLEKQEAELRALERETVQLRGLAGDSRLVLSSADALNSRLHALSLLLDDLGHRAEQVEPGTATIEQGFVVIPLRLVTWSSYEETRSLITELYTSFPDLRIIGLELSSANTPSGVLTTSLQMNWYATPAERRLVSAERGQQP